jgi:hypothetical protein
MVILPCAFAIAIISVTIPVLTYNLKLSAAIRKLEGAYRTAGVNWSWRKDSEFRRLLSRAPEKIPVESSFQEVKGALNNLIQIRLSMGRVWILMGLIVAVAVPVLVIAGFADLYYQW